MTRTVLVWAAGCEVGISKQHTGLWGKLGLLLVGCWRDLNSTCRSFAVIQYFFYELLQGVVEWQVQCGHFVVSLLNGSLCPTAY